MYETAYLFSKGGINYEKMDKTDDHLVGSACS